MKDVKVHDKLNGQEARKLPLGSVIFSAQSRDALTKTIDAGPGAKNWASSLRPGEYRKLSPWHFYYVKALPLAGGTGPMAQKLLGLPALEEEAKRRKASQDEAWQVYKKIQRLATEAQMAHDSDFTHLRTRIDGICRKGAAITSRPSARAVFNKWSMTRSGEVKATYHQGPGARKQELAFPVAWLDMKDHQWLPKLQELHDKYELAKRTKPREYPEEYVSNRLKAAKPTYEDLELRLQVLHDRLREAGLD